MTKEKTKDNRNIKPLKHSKSVLISNPFRQEKKRTKRGFRKRIKSYLLSATMPYL